MKQSIFFLVWLVAISFCSCKDDNIIEGENPISLGGQDRDEDKITGDNYVYHIPVIFHVFCDDRSDSTQYIPQKRLAQILANVNELYKGDVYNRNLDTIASENIHIQFELALKDEKGNVLSTPGVEYVPYPDGKDSIDYKTFMNDETRKYQKYLWDPNDYINIMVYKFTSNNSTSVTLGISNMPYKVGNKPDLEGLKSYKYYPITKEKLPYAYCISINAIYMGAQFEGTRYTTDKEKTNYLYNSADPNATLAHELGHYLGLKHVFCENSDDDAIDSDDDTDYCTDTPSYNRVEYEKWLTDYVTKHDKYTLQDLIIRNNSNGKKWYADNLMDYNACLNVRFTPDQAYRMRQVLYYSPLIPGPKYTRTASKATRDTEGESEELPIVLSEPRQIHQITTEVRISR